MATKSNRRQLKTERNTIETLKEGTSDIVKSVSSALTDEAQIDINLAWKRLLGDMGSVDKTEAKTKNTNQEYDLKEGEEIVLSVKEKRVEVAPGIDYTSEIIHAHSKRSNETNRQLNTKIEELRIEIAKLSKSSKQLEVLVKDASITNVGPNPGKYHLNFFEWVLATVQIARIRVEESTNWLSTVSAKAGKKDYWSLSKKHGTSYMLSGERVVAQQTG